MAFIIGSGSSEFKEDIEVIKEVLNDYGLEGYFAPFSEKEIGLEIFCNKICLKIRESQFCVALLNNPIIKVDKRASNSSEELRTPSANVYFEFGMAIALEKSVIPIIRRDLELPFDVQNLDTIMYGDSSDLRKKLTSSLPAVLSKKKKEIRTKDLKLVEKILEPLSSILQKHIAELGTFGFISTYEITDILEKEAYYTARMPSDLLERLKKIP